MESEELRSRLVRAASYLKGEGAQEVWLFGSQASGQATERSDVDLVVIGLSLDLYTEIVGTVRTIIGRPLDMVLMSKRQFDGFFIGQARSVRRLA